MNRVPWSEITLKIPLGRAHGTGQFSTFVFTILERSDFCANTEMEWRKNSAKSAPFHSGAYTKPRTAQTAPFSLPNGARMESEALVANAPLRKNSAKELPKNTPQEDLILAQEIIADLASDLSDLDSQLAPVWDEECRLKDRILATHGMRDGVVLLNLDRAGDRAPIFSKFSEIARKWGPLKTKRGNLNRQVKSLERHIGHLQKLITAEARKKRTA